MRRYLAVCTLALAMAPFCVAEDDQGKAIEEAFQSWKTAWNGGKPETLIALFHPESMPQRAPAFAADRVKKLFTTRISGYGQIKAMRSIGIYEDGSACCVRIDFAHNADFPVVFLLKEHGDKVMFYDFLPGQDPSAEADETAIAGFLERWKTGWNNGQADSLLEQLHPFGVMALGVSSGDMPKEGFARAMKGMLEELGTIQNAEVRGFKKRTNEYIVDFTYAKAGKIAAALNLQKDAKGTWRVFSFDIDDGERALKDPDSWRCQ